MGYGSILVIVTVGGINKNRIIGVNCDTPSTERLACLGVIDNTPYAVEGLFQVGSQRMAIVFPIASKGFCTRPLVIA